MEWWRIKSKSMSSGFILACFFFFLYSNNVFYSFYENYDYDNLVNPLQEKAQLSFSLFDFQYTRWDVRERNLILLCFLLSVISTFYIKGIQFWLELDRISIFSILIYLRDIDYFQLGFLLNYSLDEGLSKWGFYLLFKQVAYYGLSISLDKEKAKSIRGYFHKKILT